MIKKWMDRIDNWTTVDGKSAYEAMQAEVEDLRAELAALWAQEPVGCITGDGFSMLYGHKPLTPGSKLYAAAGAAPVPDGSCIERDELLTLIQPKSREDVAAIFDGLRSELANLNRHLDAVAADCAKGLQAASTKEPS